MTDTEQSDSPIRVGTYRQTPVGIFVEREPENGVAWVASAGDIDHEAIGHTPREAVEHLLRVLDDLNYGHGESDAYDAGWAACMEQNGEALRRLKRVERGYLLLSMLWGLVGAAIATVVCVVFV